MFLSNRCTYHLFTQKWQKHVSGRAATEIGNGTLVTLKKWIDTWICEIDNEYEFTDSVNRFQKHISSLRQSLGDRTYNELQKLWNTSMEPCTTKWARCYRTDKMDIEHTTSSIGESMNSSLKGHSKKKMGAMTIDNSSENMLLHSKKLDHKRTGRNARQLNTVAKESSVATHGFLTNFSLVSAEYMSKRKHKYYAARRSASSFLVMHVNAMSTSYNSALCEFIIPKYSNVFEVTVQEGGKTCKCTCGAKARNGMPCIHMYVVMGEISAQMFHPRWYKSYNSHLYDTDERIRTSLQDLRCWHEENPQLCKIEGIWLDSEFTEIEYMNGANAEILKAMEGLERMHKAKECLIRGKHIPGKFVKDYQQNTSELTDDQPSFDVEIDYDDAAGDPGMKGGETMGRSQPKEKEQCDNYGLHSYLQSMSRDISNVCHNNTRLTNEAKRTVDDLYERLAKSLNEELGLSVNEESAIISSQSEINRSPNAQRYKMCFERKK